MSFVYRHVEPIRVIDGDTVVLTIDMGNRIFWMESFRLAGIDTPERGQAGFDEAAARLKALLASGISRIETFKPDKYGRWLADLYVPGDQGFELCVNTIMVDAGFAKPYSGGKKGLFSEA